MKFLCDLADEIGLEHKVLRLLPDKPIVIMTLKGKDPSLPSLLLNSHMDVVPVFPVGPSFSYCLVDKIQASDFQEHWKYDPFSAHKDEDGNIFARGAQDMKSIGIQ